MTGPGMDDRLLEILVCPLCKATVQLHEEKLVCTECGRRYPIRDGIPVMLVEEAELPPGPNQRGAEGPADEGEGSQPDGAGSSGPVCDGTT